MATQYLGYQKLQILLTPLSLDGKRINIPLVQSPFPLLVPEPPNDHNNLDIVTKSLLYIISEKAEGICTSQKSLEICLVIPCRDILYSRTKH